MRVFLLMLVLTLLGAVGSVMYLDNKAKTETVAVCNCGCASGGKCDCRDCPLGQKTLAGRVHSAVSDLKERVAARKTDTVKSVNSDELKKMLKAGDVVVIDFYADWCGPCKRLAPKYEAWAAKYSKRAKFVKVDADTNKDLVKEYEVTAIPAIFVQKTEKTKLAENTEEALKTALEKAEDERVALPKEPAVEQVEQLLTPPTEEKD